MAYLLKASVVMVLFYGCYVLFLKRETFFEHNRWFLLVGLIVSIVFPMVVIPIYITIEPTPILESINFKSENFTTTAVVNKTPFDWLNLTRSIYIIGLLVFTIKFLFQFGSLLILLIKNPKNNQGAYTYIIVKNNISPFSFFRWIVYNPEQFEDKELTLILNHEKVHVRQAHSIDMLLSQLTSVVFWFNPFIWFYKKDVQQNLEYIADYKAQNTSENEKDYQRLLLKTSVANHNMVLPNNFYNSLIKKRIVMLHKSRSKNIKQWKYLLILPLLATFLMSVNTKEVFVEKENSSIIEITITSNLTFENLEEIKKNLVLKGIYIHFNDIEFSTNKKISKIDIDTKFNTIKKISNWGFSEKTKNNGIAPIKLYYDNNTKNVNAEYGSIKLGKQFDYTILNKTPNEKQFSITNAAKKDYLKSIENYFKDNFISTEVKFSNLSYNNGKLSSFDFQTKMADKKRFFTRFSIKGNDKGISSFILIPFEEHKIIKKYSDGDLMIFTPSGTTIKTKQTSLPTSKEIIENGINQIIQNGFIEIIFSKDTSKKDFEGNREWLKQKNVSFNIQKIERNDKGEITYINIDFITKNGTVNYTIKGNRPITPFYFNQKVNGEFGVESVIQNSSRYYRYKNDYNLNLDSDIKASENFIKKVNDSLTIKEIKTDPLLIENGILKNDISAYQNNALNYLTNGKKPLFVIDGKNTTEGEFSKLKAENIKSVTVLKDENAIELYGEEGENGVIVIITKKEDVPTKVINKNNNIAYILSGKQISKEEYLSLDNKSYFTFRITREENPEIFNSPNHKNRTEDTIIFINSKKDENTKITGFEINTNTYNLIVIYIDADTSNEVLNRHRLQLKKEDNIDVTFSKMKRNNKGGLTSIKISIDDNKGAKASATWRNNKAIPEIEFGKNSKGIFARTKQ